jgi:hypothetical protein
MPEMNFATNQPAFYRAAGGCMISLFMMEMSAAREADPMHLWRLLPVA